MWERSHTVITSDGDSMYATSFSEFDRSSVFGFDPVEEIDRLNFLKSVFIIHQLRSTTVLSGNSVSICEN
jgi:hypothetical protein